MDLLTTMNLDNPSRDLAGEILHQDRQSLE